ncbi:Beta-1-adaptin [Intoshia linei]|uniref:AP complex subunit beta n=1 Tax=Intoshia linei TaxID=1819745 RepID=A0A177B3I7_9BILA|nr:Beta-1-adaptin [Intoshia linei]
MSDGKYFSTTKKGEIHDLKGDLASDKKEKRKEAIKKVIANMTTGKDVSVLFPNVVNCMQSDVLELKKLVYLYLMNYAKAQPDLAIMAVNTFTKDCDDPNPFIRALAVRTMGCIRVNRITEYLCDPLRNCLSDSDPYVRKTAAICVAKLYSIKADLVENHGFLELLYELISDSNPMVISNAVASMNEICMTSQKARDMFKIDFKMVNKLLTTLHECSEWGQIFIIDAISKYRVQNAVEAKGLCERISARLSHANSAIVCSSVKVIMKALTLYPAGGQFVSSMYKKLAPPLITLLSSEPEIQFCVLRNINIIVQKIPSILENEMRVFYVKYNDPIYIKLEKLDIMIRLTNASNISNVLEELKQYASEIDVDFVRKAVRSIGLCAIKVEKTADQCVATLQQLILTKVNYVTQEAIIVIKDIFRRYPNKYENIIAILCDNLNSLDEPEARASLIWILGEYAHRIDNVGELLEVFVSSFKDETTQVQLQILTACVKLFLRIPQENQELVQQILHLATQETDNADLRDRGYIYWRLLSTDANAARDVILAERPLISAEVDILDKTLLDELIDDLSSLASILYKSPRSFIDASVEKLTASKTTTIDEPLKTTNEKPTVIQEPEIDLLGFNDDSVNVVSDWLKSEEKNSSSTEKIENNKIDDLLDLFSDLKTDNAQTNQSKQNAFESESVEILDSIKGDSMSIHASYLIHNSEPTMKLIIKNQTSSPLNSFAIQFNKNTFGLSPEKQISIEISPNSESVLFLKLSDSITTQKLKVDPIDLLQIAVKNNVGKIYYFTSNISVHCLFTSHVEMSKFDFLTLWKDLPSFNENYYDVPNVEIDKITEVFKINNVFMIAAKTIDNLTKTYYSLKIQEIVYLIELTLSKDAQMCIKSSVPDNHKVIHTSLISIINSLNTTNDLFF